MAQQQTGEEVAGRTSSRVASSYPNTPLNKSRTEQQCLAYNPAASGETAVHPSSTHCLPSAVVCASFQAATFRPQEAPARIFVSDGCSPSTTPRLPQFKPPPNLFRRRGPPFTDLLLANVCLSCQVASHQVLEQHVRRRKFKSSCESFTHCLRLRVSEAVAPAFPGEKQWPVLAAAASLCTSKQQCKLLLTAQNNASTPESFCVTRGVRNDFSVSPPYPDTQIYLAQTQGTSGAGDQNVSCTHALCSPVPASATDAVPGNRDLPGARLSFAAAAEWSTKESHFHPVLNRSVRARVGRDKTFRTVHAASAAEEQRSFPVQHIRISCNVNGTPEIAFQITPLTQKDREESGDFITSRRANASDAVATAAVRVPEVPNSFGSKSGKGAAAGDEGSVNSEEASAPARRDIAPGHTGTERARAISSETECSPEPSAPRWCTAVAQESPPSLATVVSAGARVGCAVPISSGAPSTVAVAGYAPAEEPGISRGRDNQEKRISSESERSGALETQVASAATRLTLLQLRGVVNATTLCCDTLDEQLQWFAGIMPQLRQLSQLEAALQTSDVSQRDRVHTAGEESRVNKGDDEESGASGATRRDSVTPCNDAGEGMVCSEASGTVKRAVPDAERSQDEAPLGTGKDRTLCFNQDWTDCVTALLSPLQQQQLDFMSVLQQLRLPREEDLTAADVLGFSSSLERTTTAESVSQSSVQLQDEIRRSTDAPAAVPAQAPVAAASTMVRRGRTGELLESAAGERRQRSPCSIPREETHAVPRFSASAADEMPTVRVAAGGTGEDMRQNERRKKGSRQQKRRIVSLAEVRDLSVLERSRDSNVTANVSREQVVTGGNMRRVQKAALRRRIAEAMDSVNDANIMAVGEREAPQIRNHSSESSLMMLEPGEGGGEGDLRTDGRNEQGISPSEKSRNEGVGCNTAEDSKSRSSRAAGERLEEEDELSAGIREIEAYCEILQQETEKLLELVTFYESFSAECLRHAVQDRDVSNGE